MTLKKASLVAACVGIFCAPALAEESLILSVCQDGLEGGASQTHEDMARFLSGDWRMAAKGTGWTLGENVMSVSIRWDDASQSMMMEGQGQSVVLNPILYNLSDDGNAPFDMSTQALTPGGLSDTELEILTDCANAPRYFWEFGSGARRSWGAILFFGNDMATGFMANSARGSRNVFMSR